MRIKIINAAYPIVATAAVLSQLHWCCSVDAHGSIQIMTATINSSAYYAVNTVTGSNSGTNGTTTVSGQTGTLTKSYLERHKLHLTLCQCQHRLLRELGPLFSGSDALNINPINVWRE